MKKTKILYLDIIIDGRFIRQLRYEWHQIFKLSDQELKDFAERKLPFLKKKTYDIEVSKQRVN